MDTARDARGKEWRKSQGNDTPITARATALRLIAPGRHHEVESLRLDEVCQHAVEWLPVTVVL